MLLLSLPRSSLAVHTGAKTNLDMDSHGGETVKVFCSIVIKYAKQRIKENFHLTL